MQREGGRPSRSIIPADVIIVFASDPMREKTVPEGPRPPFRANNEPMTLNDVYYHYATRVAQNLDRHRRRRKWVIQAEWFLQCLEEGRRDDFDKVKWEIQSVSYIYLPVCANNQGRQHSAISTQKQRAPCHD